MDDLISRRALCDYALNQTDKSVTPNDIMRFPSVQTKQWIPCSIKPPKDGWYLVTTKSRTVKMSYFKHGPNRDSWVMGATKPIAWMPLPEGYKK